MSQRQQRKRKKTPVPVFENRFEVALSDFAARLLETAPISHTVSKGNAREHSLASFLGTYLPGKFQVTSGIAVDTYNKQSPQLDALIYDQTVDFPFSSAEEKGVGVLAAEALLVSVEVKSRLTVQEVEKSCAAARKLRELRPFGKGLVGADKEQHGTESNAARYHHSIFAFDTDLVETRWPRNEAKRLRSFLGDGEHLIDAIYVLKRGLIVPVANKSVLEDQAGSAIAAYYFSLLNFIQRESARRAPTPYSEYASLLMGPKWVSLEG